MQFCGAVSHDRGRMKAVRDWFSKEGTNKKHSLQGTSIVKPLQKPIAFMVQFGFDKVRPPVKPGVWHGAILRNVRKSKKANVV
jgi:hypothetical protein